MGNGSLKYRDTFPANNRLIPRGALAAFLAFAVMGTFTLSTAGTLRFAEAEGSRSSPGNFFALTNPVDWLAEDTASIGKANRNASFTPRSGTLHMHMPAGIQSTAESLSGSLPHILHNSIPTPRNAVHVKLLT